MSAATNTCRLECVYVCVWEKPGTQKTIILSYTEEKLLKQLLLQGLCVCVYAHKQTLLCICLHSIMGSKLVSLPSILPAESQVTSLLSTMVNIKTFGALLLHSALETQSFRASFSLPVGLSVQKRPVEDSDWRKNVEAMSGMEGRKKMFDAAKGPAQWGEGLLPSPLLHPESMSCIFATQRHHPVMLLSRRCLRKKKNSQSCFFSDLRFFF